jgi:hypothetical protein
LRLLRKSALSRHELEMLGKKSMTLVLWVLGAVVLLLWLALTIYFHSSYISYMHNTTKHNRQLWNNSVGQRRGRQALFSIPDSS